MTPDHEYEPTDPRTYFGPLADGYDRFRPGYPDAAIDYVLEGLPGPVTAADVGAGTGISSRALAIRGVRVTAIEPNDGMRLVAQRMSASIEPAPVFRAGTGETTGLGDASVDLVVCAQSFHWLEPRVALAEFHRILRPGGRLALMWNVRADEATGFAAAYEDIMRQAQDDAARRGLVVRRERTGDALDLRPWFTDMASASYDNAQPLTRDGLLGRARSASYFPPAGSAERSRLERSLLDAHGEHAAPDGVVSLEQQTRVTIATRA
jgi:SAM-dependent methyltransferase